MALIKRKILTSLEVFYAKSCPRNLFLFCKKGAFQNVDFFLAYIVSLSEKKLTQQVCKDVSSFSR